MKGNAMDKELKEVIARMKAIHAEQGEIERKAALENEDKIEGDALASYKALHEEYETLAARKTEIEGVLAIKQSRQSRDVTKDFEPAVLPRRSPDNSGSPSPKAGKELPGTPVENDDAPTARKFTIPANVRRIGTPKNFKADGEYSAQERAYRFGMWALASISNQMPNRYNFSEARKFVQNYMGDVLNVAMSESSGASGVGYLVPTEFGTDLIDLRERYGVARRLFKMVRMSSDSRTDPRRQSGLTAYFTTEGAAGTESSKTWDQVTLTARDLMVLARYTNQLNADSVISIGDDLAGEIAYAFSNKEDECGFNGTGASTYGGIQGIRHKLQNLDTGGTDSAGLVTQGTGSTWGAIGLADFNNVVGTLPQYADTPSAGWVCHKAFYHGVMQKLELASGGVTAMEVANGDRRPRPLFLGYPVDFSQVFPSTTASAHVPVIFGDCSLAASFGDRQMDQIAFSEHATIGGESVFERNQIAIRGTERFDINVHDVGTASTAGPVVGLVTG